MKLRPLGSRVVIEPIEHTGQTLSGILLPETAKEKSQQGRVVAAGAGERDKTGARILLNVQVGDEVLYAQYAGTEVKIEDHKYLILKENDILAVFERKPEDRIQVAGGN